MSSDNPDVINIPPFTFNIGQYDNYSFNFTNGSGGLITLGPPYWTGAITGFQSGDALTVEDVSDSWTSFSYNQSQQALQFAGSNGKIVSSIPIEEPHADYYTTTSFTAVKEVLTKSFAANFVNITTDVACFAHGTLILTRDGEIPIEALVVGQEVVTASGELRRIRWIGHRAVNCSAHPDAPAVWPYRILAGAFGRGIPTRDVLLSPGHSIASEGILAAIEVLANGCTVYQEPVDNVTYWHIELDSHDVLLAHGLAAESYLDVGNRPSFTNGGDCLILHPDFQTRMDAPTCLPLRREGPEITAIRRRLLDEILARGHSVTTDPQLHLLADGVAIWPWTIDASGCSFLVSERCTTLKLASNVWVPENLLADSCDKRRLGVQVRQVIVDGAQVELDDLANDGRMGWHALERDTETTFRWTDGCADLPSGRVILLKVNGGLLYREGDLLSDVKQLKSMTASNPASSHRADR